MFLNINTDTDVDRETDTDFINKTLEKIIKIKFKPT